MKLEQNCLRHLVRSVVGMGLLVAMVEIAGGQIVQLPSHVLPDGSAFLMVEAEDAFELNDGDPADQEGFGWVIVDKDDPIVSVAPIDGDFDILPEDTDASGGAAIMRELSGNGIARWQVQFETPGKYYLYTSWSVYNRDANPDYLNEDSFYLPPAFNLNSSDDWFGFEGTNLAGEPKEGDSDRDGYINGNYSLQTNVVDKGVVTDHNTTEEQFFEGQFSWFWLSEAADMDENNSDQGPNGHAIVYEVSEEEVGTVLDFEIASREAYGVIDAFLFSTSNDLLQTYSQAEMDALFNIGGNGGLPGDFDKDGSLDIDDINALSAAVATGGGEGFDLNGDGAVDTVDLNAWIKDEANSWIGDANLDGEFNSGDLVVVFTSGKFETVQAAVWEQGDWNGDGVFNSGDFVSAFTDGGYELGPRALGQAVPEPSACLLSLLAIAGMFGCRRR